MKPEIEEAIKYLATKKKIESLKEEKEKLEEELETGKFGAPKKEILRKMSDYFTRD